jgi:hypothetical protein
VSPLRARVNSERSFGQGGCAGTEEGARGDALLVRLRDQVRVLARMNHQHVIKYLGSFTEGSMLRYARSSRSLLPLY